MFNVFRKNVTIIPKNAGYYDVRGIWIEISGTSFIILASVQPLNPRDMQELPEGRYTSQSFKMYSSIKLLTVEQTKNPDIILIDGERFEVTGMFPYQSNIISHYKMLIEKVAQGQ